MGADCDHEYTHIHSETQSKKNSTSLKPKRGSGGEGGSYTRTHSRGDAQTERNSIRLLRG